MSRAKNIYVDILTKMTPDDMSDLESDGDEIGFVVKQPLWRSPRSTNAIAEVDKQINYKLSRKLGTPTKRKKRE